MTYDTDNAGRSRLSPGLNPTEFERADRILLGACAAIWLVALGAGVAATVALVDLGRGHPEASGDSSTPWLLYAVIAVSAVVIVGAVPLLLRARRAAMVDAESPAPPAARPALGRPQARETPMRAGATAPGRFNPPASTRGMLASAAAGTAVDQISLRCALVIACAIGVAMVAIGVGTYLMAVDSNVAAWVFYAVAGLVTLAMPAVPWYFLNELRALDEPA